MSRWRKAMASFILNQPVDFDFLFQPFKLGVSRDKVSLSYQSELALTGTSPQFAG